MTTQDDLCLHKALNWKLVLSRALEAWIIDEIASHYTNLTLRFSFSINDVHLSNERLSMLCVKTEIE